MFVLKVFGLDSVDWYESDSDVVVLTYQILDSKKGFGLVTLSNSNTLNICITDIF